MDLEHLTKSQVLLLALLVTIVSSATTGIVTVSLLGQAPPAVAEGVGSIIERTVREVVFATSTPAVPEDRQAAAAAIPATPAPSRAIAKVQKSVILLVVQGDMERKPVARGLVTGAHQAITDAGSLAANTAYQAVLPDGSTAAVISAEHASTSPIAVLTLGTSSPLVPAALADTAALELGEAVIRIGGASSTAAAEGIVSAPPATSGRAIEADVSSDVPGSVLIDLTGAAIGMTTTQSLAQGAAYYSLIK